MTPSETRMLAKMGEITAVNALKTVLKNSKGSSECVYRAAFERLIVVSAGDHDDPVALACWQMVHTVEQVRRELGRKVWRMNRLRPKIEREGPHAALEYCALHTTDGFQEVLDYGLPHFTAEAIVLGFPDAFPSEQTRAIARARLQNAGLDPAQFEHAG